MSIVTRQRDAARAELAASLAARAAYRRQVAAAKAICRRCPVRTPCGDYAIRERVDGIWGGRTEGERRIRRRRQTRPIRQQRCERCGAQFWTVRGRYCGDPCRTEAARAARCGARIQERTAA